MTITGLVRRHRSRIGQKFVSMVVVVSALGAVMATIAQLTFDYREESARIDRGFRDVSTIYLDAISRSLWVGDADQLGLQLTVISRALNLESAIVKAPDGKIMSSVGTKAKAWSFEHVVPITYLSDGRRLEIGTLYLTASGQDVATFLSRRLMVILGTNWLKTGFVALGLLYAFRRMIGRHLNKIAHFAAPAETAASGALSLNLDRPPVNGRPSDELDRIANSINGYMDSVHDLLREKDDALRRLQRSNANLQMIIENRNRLIENSSAPIFCLNANLRVTVWNAAMEAVTGVPHESALSREFITDFIDAGSREPATELFTRALQRYSVTRSDLSILAADGEVKRVIISASPLLNVDGRVVGVIGIGQDVSELIELQAADVARQQRASSINRLLMESISLASYAAGDIDAFARYVCERAGACLNADRVSFWAIDPGLSTLRCREIWEAAPVPGPRRHRLPVSDAQTFISGLLDNRVLVSNGGAGEGAEAGLGIQGSVALSAPVRRGGQLAAVLCFERSVSRGQWAPDEQTASVAVSDLLSNVLEIELRRSAEREAHAASAAKSEFLAHMSHELRTPLNAIIGFSEMLQGQGGDTWSESRRREYVDHIHASGEHLLRIVEDILDIAKIEAGTLPVVRERVNVVEDIEAIVGMLEPKIRKKKLEVIQNFESKEVYAYCDKQKIRQVLTNVIGNSVKFAGDHDQIKIGLQVAQEKDMIALTFSDNGPGIPAEDLPLVLAPFGQARSGSLVAHEGAGLGLPIAKSLTELCGGRFELKSEVGKGTSVTIELRTDA